MSNDYSVEAVAAVAVHLLSNNNHTEAAKEAIKLLDACRAQLATRAKYAAAMARARERIQEKDKRLLRDKSGKPRKVLWPELFKYVTGVSREERAIVKMRTVLRRMYQHHQATALGVPDEKAPQMLDDELFNWIDKLKKEGTWSMPALEMKDFFDQFVEKKQAS